MWIQRDIEPTLAEVAARRPALILTGARQAGKTSLLQRVFPDHRYASLDVPRTAELAEEAGEQFLREHPAPLIIDEVQYAPRLLRWLKAAIDQRRDGRGLYCLTGSQKFPLMQGVTESLAGRVAVIECHSLSARELERWSGKTAEGTTLLEWIVHGGYPELHARDLPPERFYGDYLSTYLERDVRQVLQVRSLRDFDRFMRLAAVRTGQLLSYNSFASDLGVSPNTVRSWLSVLQASNVVYLLEPYYRNLGKRIVKAPKLYFTDTGLAAYLAGVRSARDLQGSTLLGPFFETHALGQLLRWHANRGLVADVYYYRDHHGHEVDFVIPVGEKLRLYECKWIEAPDTRVRGFDEVTRLIGEHSVLSRSILTPVRGTRARGSVTIGDSIEWPNLPEA
jgi:hypothetical protein